jgi:AMIN domain
MGRLACAMVAVPLAAVLPSIALAQNTGGDAASADAAPAQAPSRGSKAPADAPRGSAGRPDPATSDALRPGFETRGDGSTRLFVDLSKAVSFEAKAGRSTVTVVLKGARVDRRNNQNPLVTVHFNTPVVSARLVPHGRDVWFVVDLRGNVQPQTTMETTKLGSARLCLEFPRGEYLSQGEARPRPAPQTAEAGSSRALATESVQTPAKTASAAPR